jgi:hypothetical protein
MIFSRNGEKKDWVLFYREALPQADAIEKEYLQIRNANYNTALDELVKHNKKSSRILELRLKIINKNEVRVG